MDDERGHERLSRGLAFIAEDMPVPDIGDIVATARARIRRRRAISATLVAIAAVVGALAATSATMVGGIFPVSAAHDPTTAPAPSEQDFGPVPVIDDRALFLDRQLDQARAGLIPAGLTVSPDPLNQVRVDGKPVGVHFYSPAATEGSVLTDRSGTLVIPPVVFGDYVLDVKLGDAQGWGTLSVNVQQVASTAEALPSCAELVGQCQSAVLPDGTRTIVLTQATANAGTDIHLIAIRPDRTYLDVTCTNVPTSADTPGVRPPAQPTRPQPPLNASDLLKFATAFTY